MMERACKSKLVELEMDGNIAVMTLCNGKQNKLYSPEFLVLNELKEFIDKKNPIGLIICGQGRHFSSGADVDEIGRHKEKFEELKEQLEKGKTILEYIENLPMVTVAAISGMCCGGGLEIALSCQFRIATSVSVFAFPEVTLGLIPGLGGTVRLNKIIGRKNAISMLLSGENYVAEEAKKIGLIDSIVEKGQHVEEAKHFIQRICEGREQVQVHRIISAINKASYEYETAEFVECVQKREV